MTLGTVIGGSLPFLRSEAESLMQDTCTIRAEVPSTGRTIDPTTGNYSTPPGDVIYTGKCRTKDATFRALDIEAGERDQVVTQILVAIPLEVTGVTERQTVTIDSSTDPALVGTVVQIVNVPHGAMMTARRLVCKEWT